MAEVMSNALIKDANERDKKRAEQRRKNRNSGQEPDVVKLPLGEIIEVRDRNNTPSVYRIEDFYAEGGWAYIYRVSKESIPGKDYLLKEFCPRGILRDPNTNLLKINYKDDLVSLVLGGFKKEPRRVPELEKRIEAEKVTDKPRLRLAIPDTDVFQYFGKYNNEGNWYFIMEKAKGENLEHCLKKWKSNGLFKKMPLDKKLEIVKETAIAVRNLHSVDCVHKDIKPANINVFYEDPSLFEGLELTLLDLGLSTDLGIWYGSKKSDVFIKGGTTGYSDRANLDSYREWFDQKNPKVRDKIKLMDIYSLGCILEELCVDENDPVVKMNALTKKKYKKVLQLIKDMKEPSLEERHKLFTGSKDEYTECLLQRIKEIQEEEPADPLRSLKPYLLPLGVVAVVLMGVLLWPSKKDEPVNSFIPVTKVKLNKDSITLYEGDTEKLDWQIIPPEATNKSIDWFAKESDIAKCENGEIKALKAGRATIFATAHNGVESICQVTVKNWPPDSIRSVDILSDTLRLQVGDIQTLKIKYKPETAEIKVFEFVPSNLIWPVGERFDNGKEIGIVVPRNFIGDTLLLDVIGENIGEGWVTYGKGKVKDRLYVIVKLNPIKDKLNKLIRNDK